MPYANNESLPPYVKKLGKHLQDIWRNAFNSAYKQYNGDESKAFAVANASVKKYKESHSIDYKKDFVDGFNRFIGKTESRKERKSDNYGNDFTENIDDFLRA